MSSRTVVMPVGVAAIVVATLLVSSRRAVGTTFIPSAMLIADPGGLLGPPVPFDGPEAALGAPWVSYQLSVETDNGIFIQAGEVTINGVLHQRWSGDANTDGIADPTPSGPPGGPAYMEGDSHLTVPVGSPLSVPLDEDNDRSTSPLSGGNTPGVTEWGIGTMLRGGWAVPGVLQSDHFDLAYIVVPIPDGKSIPDLSLLDIQVRVVDVADFADFTARDFFVPEPGTMMLAGLAVAALFSYCRRGRDERM